VKATVQLLGTLSEPTKNGLSSISLLKLESKKNLTELFVADSMTVIFILELNSVKKCKHFTVKSFYLEH